MHIYDRSIDKSSQQSNFNYQFFKLLQSKSVKFINLPRVPLELHTSDRDLSLSLALKTLKIHIDHHIKLKLEHFSFPIPIYH